MSIIARNQSYNLKKLFHVLAQTPPRKGDQTLVLKIGKIYSCFAITDATGKQLHELAYYTSDEINEDFLNRLLILHPELNQLFDKVIVNYDYEHNVLIPEQNFKKEEGPVLINVLHGIGKGFTTISDSIPENGFYLIYTVPTVVHEWVIRKFPFSTFNHTCRFRIKEILNNSNAEYLMSDFNTDTFSVSVCKEKQLLLSQSFPYTTPDDVIYYLLKICNQFSIAPAGVKLILSGLIEQQSTLFHELYQYFLNIDFKNADWIVKADNEYPLHFFASLKETIQCES